MERNIFWKAFYCGFLICFNFMLVIMFDFWNGWESVFYWTLITSTAFLTGFIVRACIGGR